MIAVDKLDFSSSDGLIPAVIQDSRTKQVLMLGYMDRDAVQKTLDTKKVTFYSRSRQRLWMKGEESGNVLHLVEIQEDCDKDALLVEAIPAGPTCHTGETSCFHQKPYSNDLAFLKELEELLYERKEQLPEGSYTSKMFRAGRDKLAQKVGEEAVETVIAVKNSREEFTYEASDLLFHLMMLLSSEDMTLQDLVSELETRHKK
ncbi:bifunctional phosphoribosyl-AMP cyclohydrolase/phosphoribosyl-ATP diphosphatase HisIE [Natronogracilivirga saccharolytica]|uniref:Histidine biosynthesis bifunctional protein HisIE n=1 Tax=Natronogracilivirga saccharolytica TaxID=2812953 RepID=A0A8J7S8H4_9BACT|nr:bifunctional phosphoribosyl-AMP cyclohydrolase/phosphoribosyl-ATP diphosphatase HisIE [Natronogracilivirga saccharolytica]MBP3192191.1 bifunctional phosphoribosyl-AMP cyclohydrolase/phosphoribosyl-ATP diphosphatase HisIE [Natronogracilivirga saccharolytica]